MKEPMNTIEATELSAPQRGAGQWSGVVMIERPDLSKLPYGCQPMCRVMSARTVQLLGRRAIYELLPYALYAHLFTSQDGDHIFHEAEFNDGHLEVYGRSNRQEWVMFSMTKEQAGGGVFTGYH